ncbi:M23 family metallopeptidase [Kitasatospora sp. NPDC036755]|uniref:M23 family metallopeptidase n=1 Tax=Kitasatospora sp. NPDC036755 TaxID=3154600 RepID=UPI0033C00929
MGGPGGLLGRFEPPAKAWTAGHRGVDLAAAPGAEIRAAAPGVIAFSGLVAGRPVVTVSHPGSGTPPLRTTYLPVTGTLPVGTPVAAGRTIGLLAPGGRHCPGRDCLHWGLLRGNRYLDPLALFGAGAARLLPLNGGAG